MQIVIVNHISGFLQTMKSEANHNPSLCLGGYPWVRTVKFFPGFWLPQIFGRTAFQKKCHLLVLHSKKPPRAEFFKFCCCTCKVEPLPMIRFWCGPHGSSNQEGKSKVFGPTPESTKAIISWLRKCAETLGYKNYEIIDHEGSIADEQTLAFAINNREGTDLPRFYFKEQKKKNNSKTDTTTIIIILLLLLLLSSSSSSRSNTWRSVLSHLRWLGFNSWVQQRP